MTPSCLLILVFAGCANALNFTSVLEWSDDFGVHYKSSSKVDPRFLAVYEEKLFLSLYGFEGVQYSLAWLHINATSPTLQPFPSTIQSTTDCSTVRVRSARGIEVDTIGRLWALDNGGYTCPPRLLIFDLTNNNTIVQIHDFADEVVSNTNGKRWLLNLVLDQSENGWFAYIAESFGRHLVVFSFERNYSWRVKIENKQIGAIALSPMRTRQLLYISEWDSKEIFSLPVADLRAGVKNASLTLKGSQSTSTYWSATVMTMDEKGNLYFNLNKHSVFKWDTNAPFKEEQLYMVYNIQGGKNTSCLICLFPG
ncbi:protein yellow-like [Cloeon dipterum]|uniref:protein yellow-like n=1 Tax=Cloeon dipterum TaxID=197152 RepID=UPI00321F6310